MKLLFFGDSITDADRVRTTDDSPWGLGYGYVNQIAGKLLADDPTKYEIINRGIAGNTVAQLYARVKEDAWNYNPDVLTILVGANDVWHEITENAGVDVKRYEKVYSALIEETKTRCPHTRIVLCEPFVLRGVSTEKDFERFLEIKKYAIVVRRLAEKYGVEFLPLQERLTAKATQYGEKYYLGDGIHPTTVGAALIANAWLEVFRRLEGEGNQAFCVENE